MGRASESKASPVISRSSSWAEASVRFAAITAAAPLSWAARASSTSVTAISPIWKRDSACSSWRLMEVERHLLRLEIVLRGEHVEVALRDALDQVLLCGLVVGFGLRDLGIGALQRHPVLPAKQVLSQIDAVAVGRGDGAPLERKG